MLEEMRAYELERGALKPGNSAAGVIIYANESLKKFAGGAMSLLLPCWARIEGRLVYSNAVGSGMMRVGC